MTCVSILTTLGLHKKERRRRRTLSNCREVANLLVVQDPATSSPGLAFLLATVARFGDEWPAYWEALRDGGVAVAGSWTDAYYTQFTPSGGDRPLVVSYATSPAAEIVFCRRCERQRAIHFGSP